MEVWQFGIAPEAGVDTAIEKDGGIGLAIMADGGKVIPVQVEDQLVHAGFGLLVNSLIPARRQEGEGGKDQGQNDKGSLHYQIFCK